MKTRSLLLAALGGGLLSATLLAQPTITLQPTNQTVSVGESVRFQVAARPSSGTRSFQWWFKDAALDAALNPSATKNILRLTNVTVNMTGDYWAVVTDDNGSVISDKARLTVDPTFFKVTSSPVLKADTDIYIPYWVDLNGDGFLDLVMAGGYFTDAGKPIFVFNNNGDGTFARDTTSDLAKSSARLATLAWGDFDNDGDLDALGGQWEGTSCVYYRNQGGGRFAKVAANASWTANGAGVRGGAVACADYDNDGWLDLVAGYWGNRATGVWGTNSVLHNLGDGRFESDRQSALALSRTWPEQWGWADFDGDGDQDLFCATSGADDQLDLLFENLGGGKFAPITEGPLVETPDLTIAPAWGDYDNDGDLDIVVSRHTQNDQLYRNEGGGVFTVDPNGPKRRGNEVPGVPAWADYDNDGWLDLFIVQVGAGGRMFHNRGDGTLEEVFLGSPTQESRGYAASWGDYDNDGFMDLVCVDVTSGNNYLYRNNLPAAGNQNHWLKIKLRGLSSNRDGIGATVRVKATIGGKSFWQMRQIISQSHDLQLIAHFGLGDATKAELIRIEWPSGNVQELTDYDANDLYTFTEPIRIQPIRPTGSLGGSVVLTAVGGVSYQWRFNGVDLPGETQKTLSLSNLTTAMAGRYSVVVTAANGTTTTNYAHLLVDTQFAKITEGPLVTDVGFSGYGSWGDYDGDSYPDVAVIPYKTGASALYRNNRDGTFSSVPGVAWATQDTWVNGTWGDFDNDGRLDFFGAREGKLALLFFGNADGSFTPSELPTLFPWNTAVADYDRDGFLDLFCSWGNSRENILFHNAGDRTFTRMTTNEVGALVAVSTFGGALWADYDDDGAMDVFCPHHQGSNRMYHNDGTGTFKSVSGPWTQTSALAGAWGDYDNDGRLDLCAASFGGTTYVYRNLGEGNFERASIGQRIIGQYNSAAWADYDNDGFLDLFLTYGNSKMNSLFRNQGDGTFAKITTGSLVNDLMPDGAGSYQGLWFDYDNDGFLDLCTINGNEVGTLQPANCLYRNSGNSNAWLRVRLIGTVSNREAIGAKVRVRAYFAGTNRWQRRDISGGDAINGNNLIAHFGLSDAAKADVVRIEWPSGIVQELTNVTAKQVLTVTEPTELAALGEGRIWVRCWKGMKYEVEVSNDLTAWTSLGVFTNETGRLEVTDADAAQHPYRFYRAIAR